MRERALFAKKLITPKGKSPLRGKELGSLEVLEDVYIVFDERIKDISKEAPGLNVQAEVSLLTPGFVDPHTHVPFYGFRSEEFVMRSEGKSYVEILKAGGGIHSTVEKVRKASLDELVSFNSKFLDEMLCKGITTVEGKSGYGLEIETELKQLKALDILNKKHRIDVKSTFLGAHAIPKEKNPEDYLEYLLENLERVKDYTNTVDIFVDEGAFSIENARYYLTKAKNMGFRIRIHADEIARTGAAVLGVELGAVSVDHLIRINEDDVRVIAESDTAALLMPGTSFYLSEDYAPARSLIDSGAIVAIGSDFNPGSNTINDPTFIFHLAVSKLKMKPEEVLSAYTLNAAHILGISDYVGSLEVGKYADMVAWKIEKLEDIPYLPGHAIINFVIKNGEIIT